MRLLKSMLITPNAPKREKQNFHGPIVHSIHRRGRNRAKTWRPASWNCRPQGTRSRALRRTSPTCWLTRAGSCQWAPAASLSPPAKTATAGLPRQYDAGGPSQPTGHLQGKEKWNHMLQNHCSNLVRIGWKMFQTYILFRHSHCLGYAV